MYWRFLFAHVQTLFHPFFPRSFVGEVFFSSFCYRYVCRYIRPYVKMHYILSIRFAPSQTSNASSPPGLTVIDNQILLTQLFRIYYVTRELCTKVDIVVESTSKTSTLPPLEYLFPTRE